jgi:hypothetical protein
MTPKVESSGTGNGLNNPISRLTIASMQDLGYTVDYSMADAYSFPDAEVNSTYDITWYFSKDFPAEYKPLFATAASRWESIITGDIPSANGIFDLASPECKIPHQSKISSIDDIKIYISLLPASQSDGLGGYTRRVEPCLDRGKSFLPAIGVMQYDPADLASIFPLLTSQKPTEIDIITSKATREITRDMGRVLGYGSSWVKKELMQFSDPDDGTLCGGSVFYIGSNALREYRLLATTITQTLRLSAGNPDALISKDQCVWSYSSNFFDYELMGNNRSKLNPGLPDTPPALSKITIGNMQDLGYTVDYSVADPFDVVLPPPNCVPPLVTSGCPNSINPLEPLR